MCFELIRLLHYIYRIPLSYGFGVQSPFAYSFIRKVVRGVNDSVLIDSLKGDKLGYSNRCIKVACLLYRFASFINADVCFFSRDQYKEPWLSVARLASCKSMLVGDVCNPIKFAVISSAFDDLDFLLSIIAPDGMLVLMDIRKDAVSFSFWNQLVADTRTYVSFDLFDVGVVFFDSKMYKCQYCCNY